VLPITTPEPEHFQPDLLQGLPLPGEQIVFVVTFLLIFMVFVVTNIGMKITFDPSKNAANIVDRGLSFDMVADIDWNDAVILEDIRKDYGERRFRVFGYIRDRLYVAVVTPRNEAVHVISFRKANTREVKEHGNQ
jgi:uncharacterized DUF497 family protein